MTTEHHFIRSLRVLTIQKVTSKELYWILITTIEHKPTPHKYIEKTRHDVLLVKRKMKLYSVFIFIVQTSESLESIKFYLAEDLTLPP